MEEAGVHISPVLHGPYSLRKVWILSRSRGANRLRRFDGFAGMAVIVLKGQRPLRRLRRFAVTGVVSWWVDSNFSTRGSGLGKPLLEPVCAAVGAAHLQTRYLDRQNLLRRRNGHCP